MAASPVKFLFGFLFASIILWLIFIFSARLVAWILSRLLRASVEFRVGGWKCLRDVVVRFKKGAVESVSVGEIRLSLRQSLVKLGVGFISKDPKLQVLICDLEVVMRPSLKNAPKAKSSKPQKARNPGKGKWMVVANMARFLSVSVTDLILKTPKATTEIKGLRVDISKDGGSKPTLVVKLNLLPAVVHVGEPRVSCNQSSICNNAECITAQSSMSLNEKTSAPFSCEEFSLLCEFGYDSDVGIVIKNVEMTSGEVSVNLSEDFLLKSRKSPEKDDAIGIPANSETAKKPQKKQQSLASISKYTSMIPEKVYFSLPKLDVRFHHREHDLLLENNITGVQLKSIKSRSSEDIGDSSRLDIQLDFSEIHLLRESGTSLLGIQKVDIVSFVYVPLQLALPIRAEIDVKLGGTQCNIMMSRFRPWMRLKMSKKKKMALQEETLHEKPKSSEPKLIMWTCTVSAPEMTVALHDFNDLPLYQACSQSSHVFANNISKTGPAVHLELGELNLHLADEYQECMKESLFGVETNLGALMHIAKVTLDWGKKDIEVRDEDGPRNVLTLSVDVTGMGVYLTFKRVESILSTALSVKAFLKSISASTKKSQYRGGRSSKPSGKGIRLLKFNLERCSVSFTGDTGVENTVVADPKRFNYGSQGGKVVISQSADGTPRTADIISTISDQSKRLKYTTSLDIFHLNLSVNKDKHSTQLELERARAIHQEYSVDQRPVTKVVLFDMQNAKFVQHSGGLKEITACSLFSATDISVRWEPDVHISLFELMLQLKLAMHSRKLQGLGSENMEETFSKTDIDQKKEGSLEPGVSDKRQKKKESIFAVDVEMLTITAEAGDGVDVVVQVQSIFSENARIGVLLEGLILDINGCRLFRSSRMQISRIPHASSSSDGRQSTSTVWDWVIQGIDVHICMPYRLQLRAIDDSVEEMLRALKLITSAKTKILFPMKTESSKPKKPSSTKLGCVRFCIRKLTADIEEEPMQGWLDEHYQLLKNEACELAVRSKFLDEKVCLGNESLETSEAKDYMNENRVNHNGVEINMKDSSEFSKLQEEMYKQSFRSYYEACQKLSVSEGSGACRTGFQSGFKTSSARTSLLSICATDLDVSLTLIEGGDDGMIEIVKRLDPVCLEKNIPFSKLYGCNILLNTVSSLAVQLRNYTYPLFSATSGKCQGRLILAQQATCFQPQVQRDVFIGKWRKVRILRSATGTTPPMKTYFDLPLFFEKGVVGFGVGFEPAFADVSYAFTVALRRANLSVREPGILVTPPKKEKSLPWWDDMRNYIHGNITLQFNETIWHILATTDPYEKLDKLTVTSTFMELQQSDGRVHVSVKDFKIILSSLESLVSRQSLKTPIDRPCAFLEAPSFTVDVSMEWGCASGSPMNHYLFAFPVEGKSREIVFDPFRSTSLSLRFNFSLRPTFHSCDRSTSSTTGDNSLLEQNVNTIPTFHMAAHDLAWLTKFWNLNYLPPHKLRTFSRWARFGVPRIVRSGNLSLDRVMTEFMLRIDATPVCIRHLPLDNDDPAKGLTFKMTKLKFEICQSRGKQNFTFECKREPLDLVYQGIDLHMPKIYLDKEESRSAPVSIQMARASQSGSSDRLSCDKSNNISVCTERHRDDGFFLSSDYFTIRRQAPKADAARLLAWQEAGRRNLEMTYVRSEFENASDTDEHTRSEPSDDDGYNVVIADNCRRVFVYGLKLLWTIENRNAVWSFVGGISKAFQPPMPSPSRQYAQRRLRESQKLDDDEKSQNSVPVPLSSSQGANTSSPHEVDAAGSQSSTSNSVAVMSTSSASNSVGVASTSSALAAKNGDTEDHEEEGTRHFMVNVIEPQFNLHSEDANGRFLLAAVSGRVLARSFHSILQVGVEVIEQLGTGSVPIPESRPEMMWKRMELSVMLEHVQAHVAPTDVDPGAGLQWLPKILRSSPKVKRTGALLERVFMPCDMYFRYTRHKGGTADLKVKPLKELTFNSQNITATMTSRQFQVMLDVLTNLLFARLPKPRKSSLSYPIDDDEDVEEEADEVVPDGVEEVVLARVALEQKEREQRLLLADIRKLSCSSGASNDLNPDKEGELWMITGGRSTLVYALKKELLNAKKIRKEASAQLRMALQKAAQLRLMEKEKNKAPSYAMRISLQINKVVWAMLVDGKPFAESEINDMRYDFDRDYKDVGVVQFMTKSFVVRNCLPNAKSDMLLSAWNPPADWGKKMMLRVDAKQGAPKDGHSPLELFQVEIYPLKIHLTETMYRTMWEYFFPEEEQDSQRRQEVWKVSTTAGLKRVKKGSLVNEAVASSSHAAKESEVSKTSTSIVTSSLFTSLATLQADGAQASKAQNLKANLISGSTPELRRTSSFDRTWEENVAESVANELVLQVHSSSKSGPLSAAEQQDDPSKNKLKDSKPVKSGRSSHEEKKTVKGQDEKRSRPRRLMEFHNIKISQVELLVTYEGSRFVVNDLKLLMDTFHRPEFTGTWRRLFSRVKKHIIWGVLKSVTGMQGKKFKDKVHNQRALGGSGVPDSDLNIISDNEGQAEKLDQHPIHFLKRPSDGAGDGFVTSVKGLFNTQRRKAKQFVLRTMRGDGENDVHGEWSESDVEFSPFARQLTITKAKRLIRRHTKKFRSRQKGSSSQQRESLPNSPRETTAFESDSSTGSDPYEDFPEFQRPL